MAEVSIREFAESVNTPVERLLVQLGEAGLPHTEANDHLNDTDKEQLLAYLRRMHGKAEEPPRSGPEENGDGRGTQASEHCPKAERNDRRAKAAAPRETGWAR